jgi:hypothetical protein
MQYITTNIRLPEEEWERLKIEAVEERKSLSEVIREKLTQDSSQKTDLQKILRQTRGLWADDKKFALKQKKQQELERKSVKKLKKSW